MFQPNFILKVSNPYTNYGTRTKARQSYIRNHRSSSADPQSYSYASPQSYSSYTNAYTGYGTDSYGTYSYNNDDYFDDSYS